MKTVSALLVIVVMFYLASAWLIQQSRDRAACYNNPATESVEECPQPGRIESAIRNAVLSLSRTNTPIISHTQPGN